MEENQKKEYFKKLLACGLTEEEVFALIEYVAADVAKMVWYDMLNAFSKGELDKINKKMSNNNLDELQQISLAALEYEKKMGVSVAEKSAEILGNYLNALANSLMKIKDMTGKMKDVTEEGLKALEVAVAAKDWEKVSQLLQQYNIKEEDFAV